MAAMSDSIHLNQNRVSGDVDMNEPTAPQTSSPQPPGNTGDGDSGVPEFQPTPGKAEGEDPTTPEGKPQGTLDDQEKNMDSEGHPVDPPPTEAG